MNRQKKRILIQALIAAISNGYIKGFTTGKIYTGGSKVLCSPGMNCYSCPGSVTACPIGSLQAVLGNKNYRLSLYVIGFMFIFGAILGRGVCGFLCPFGFIQDLLYKIPFFKKIRKLPGEKILRKIKYVMLSVLVVFLSYIATDSLGKTSPYFCKYVCPVGTLEGGIPLVLLNSSLRTACDFLFAWKILILIIIILGSIMVCRPFCRYLCPLGAVYSFFNKHSIYKMKVDINRCNECGQCQRVCVMDIPVYKNPNSMDCIRCGKCIDGCKNGCISGEFTVLTHMNNKDKI